MRVLGSVVNFVFRNLVDQEVEENGHKDALADGAINKVDGFVVNAMELLQAPQVILL